MDEVERSRMPEPRATHGAVAEDEGITIKSFFYIDTLSPTLSLRERGL
jgi:hypothetical protein